MPPTIISSPLRRLIALILSPLAALSARAQEFIPSGFDPSDEVIYQIMPIAWRVSSDRLEARREWLAGPTGGVETGGVESGAGGGGPGGGVPIEVRHRFGDFKGMTESLDYLSALGVTGIWMTPIFPSRAYHGYQHGAADDVNHWFGTREDFIGFVRSAHALGMKVYIDLVVYGISQDSTWFQNALRDPGHPDAGMFAIAPDDSSLRPGPVWRANRPGDRRAFQGYDFKTWTGETIGIAWWDLRREAPRDLVASWCRYWMDPDGDGDFSDGVDGFRLDHVWGRYPHGPDGWGYGVGDFWIPWKKELQRVNPRVFTFAEQAQWENNGIDLLPAHDAALAKPLLFAIRESIASGKAGKAAAALEKAMRQIPAGRTLLGSIGDHDVDRVASSLSPPPGPAPGPAPAPGTPAPAPGTGSPPAREAADELDRAKLAAGILLTLPLPPVIYFGDEIGMTGRAGSFGSDANDIPRREPFKWTAAGPGENPDSPMTDYWRAHAGVIEKRFSRDGDGRSVEEQQGRPGSVLETYRELIRLRRESVALRRGDYLPIKADEVVSGGDGQDADGGSTGDAVWVFGRIHDKGKMVVAVNVSTRERTVAFARSRAWHGRVVGPWRDRATYEVGEDASSGRAIHTITVPPLGVALVEIAER
ncbi:MAG: hypothetical protein JNK70_09960 [Phycisphaerae bacterium]|nr:hypothetical protein [Phycisphaerae bacterium]